MFPLQGDQGIQGFPGAAGLSVCNNLHSNKTLLLEFLIFIQFLSFQAFLYQTSLKLPKLRTQKL